MALTPSEDIDLPIAGASPTLDTDASSVDCDHGLSMPVKITKVLLMVLRNHFQIGQIEAVPLRNRIYTDDESSEIAISSLAEWNPNESGKRPAILVQPLSQVPKWRGIDNRFFGGANGDAFEFRHASFWMGRHVIHSIGGREGEAYALASEVFRHLHFFESRIREYLNFMQFRVVEMGARMKLDEHKNTWAVPIAVEYVYELAWRTKQTDVGTLQKVILAVEEPED